MSLIDTTYFTKRLSIAEVSGLKQGKITEYISRYEPEFMRKYFGYAFYLLITTEVSQRMTDLKNGVAYTYNDKQYYFDGLANATLKISPIANYVYFQFLRDEAEFYSGVGAAIPATENATRVGPINKQVTAWNDMIDMLIGLRHYLHATETTYPEYESNLVSCLHKTNVFNL